MQIQTKLFVQVAVVKVGGMGGGMSLESSRLEFWKPKAINMEKGDDKLRLSHSS